MVENLDNITLIPREWDPVAEPPLFKPVLSKDE